jgi:thiol-disulfide isomerase/thioredoxin
VSVDAWATLNKYKEELALPFDLLSDWDRETSKKYGTFNQSEGVANRKSFLIDKDGVVRFTQQSGLEEPRKHEEMLEAVRRLGAASESRTGEEVGEAGRPEAVFYEFYSETCSHCKKMKPVVEEFRKAHGDKFTDFRMVPWGHADDISLFHDFGVEGTPTFIITDKEGKEIDRITGEHSLEVLVRFMNSSFRRMSK